MVEGQEASNSAKLELAQRRELARKGVSSVRDILGVDVSLMELLETSKNADAPHSRRLVAKRAVRFLGDISGEGSELARRVRNDDDMYAAAEAIVVYGASNRRYLGLMDELPVPLTPVEATGIYALKQTVDDNFGTSPTLGAISESLRRLSIDPRLVHEDVDEVVATIQSAGFIVDGNPFGDTREERLNPFRSPTSRLLEEEDPQSEYSQNLRELLEDDFRYSPQ